jgi:hypothetical protein
VDDSQADDSQADDGQADDGQVDDSQADDSQADDGQVDDSKQPGPPSTDDSRPASPYVRFTGFCQQVWWWIGAWRRIGCIGMHRIDRGARIHHDNRGTFSVFAAGVVSVTAVVLRKVRTA